MSWKPGGGSGSFRRPGLIDSTFRLSGSARSSDDESAGSKPSSSSSSFLRMRPISGSGENNGSARLGSLLRSNDRASNLNIPSTSSSRSSSFRSSREKRDSKVDRSNSWKRSNFSSPVSQYFSDKSKQSETGTQGGTQSGATGGGQGGAQGGAQGGGQGGGQSGGQSGSEGESKSSTLPWSYSSRSYQPLNFTNPFTHHREREEAKSGGRTPAQSPPAGGSEEEASPVTRTPSSASSLSWTPPSSTTSTLPARRKVQKVQLLHLTEPCRELIAPSEVTVTAGHEVFVAQPVITNIEQLRRKDKEVARALEEKQKLIEEILNIPHEELESITEYNTAGAQPKTAAEILLSALSQAKSLTSLVNRSLKISEEEALEVMSGEAGALAEQQRIVAKGERLIEITTTINKQLTMLLAIIQENERERESLRRELSCSQEQVRCLLSDAPWSSPLSPITPASISPLPSPITSKSSSPPLSISEGLSR